MTILILASIGYLIALAAVLSFVRGAAIVNDRKSRLAATLPTNEGVK